MVERKEEVAQQVTDYPVNFRRMDREILSLKFDYDRNKLVLQPNFQGSNVWDDSKASRFVESIFLHIPTPMIYTAVNSGIYRKEVVLDGQQRITSVIRFMRDEFVLRGLIILKHLNGKKFSELSKAEVCDFEGQILSTTRIEATFDSSVVYEILERINSGTANLNE